MTRSNRLSLLPAGAIIALSGAAAADPPAACAEAGRYPYPQAARAAAAWSPGEVAAAPELLQGVLAEYCIAADTLAREKNLTPEQIDRYSDKVVGRMLAKEADETKLRPTAGALLRSELGAQGFSRPVIKRSARLAIRYELEVDAFQVGPDTFPKRPLLLVPPGQVPVQGIRNGKAVCGDTLTLVAGQAYHYTCTARLP